MNNFPRVRYAGLIALLGLAATYLPGLSVQAQGVVGDGSLLVAVLLAGAKLLRELLAQVQQEDPMEYHTMGRSLPGFWRRVI